MAYSTILQVAGQSRNQALGFLVFIFIVAGVVLAQKKFKEQGDGFMPFGKGFVIGFMVLLISGLLNSLFTYVYLTILDPSSLELIKEQGVEESIKNMESQGMSDAEIDQALEFSEVFLTAEFITGAAFLTSLLIGTVLVLIITAVTQKKNPVLDL